MWRDNLVRVRKEHGNPSYKKIATDLKMSERTVVRVFTSQNESFLIETISPILKYFGVSWSEIFDDTGAVIGTSNYAEVQANLEVVTAENGILTAENNVLKDKVTAQEAEIALLNMKLQHKDELLALHNYYKSVISGMSK